MERRRLVGVILGCLVSLTAATNASAQSKPDKISADFSVMGSNDFQIYVEGSRHSVTVSVSKGGLGKFDASEADYTAPATTTKTEIQADIGGLVGISMHFHPSKTRRFKAVTPTGCRPYYVTRQIGTFVGTFRFTGEGNYTSAETITAKGSTGTPVTNFCGAFEGSGNGHHPHVDHHRPPPSQSLQAVTANHLLIFQALAGGNPRRVQFFANLKETIGAISIVRFIATGGPASDFLLAQNPDGATIAPPPPFAGSATVESQGKGVPPLWSGDLSAFFPGKPEVPLTGSDFSSVEFHEEP